ncbi:transmembrane protein, putative (macronuclear) [Tetrahymena thermophila SB210]|uniref:Transmembrane protein, putative n=1 Tax=Tetrahymena thermophila (strain SB210) TaxID=312017 RepID=W7X7Q7_TETTS|nr:transmembrane protein, putative [Tetrahymena thermophila SB210]EWS75405.1 transmembrane protein, putative [Tetrahymena thermophila SB210]|eukprot:XP_012652079.1 transmembrane protein, putative [Tetrahymena thermophila SB210]
MVEEDSKDQNVFIYKLFFMNNQNPMDYVKNQNFIILYKKSKIIIKNLQVHQAKMKIKMQAIQTIKIQFYLQKYIFCMLVNVILLYFIFWCIYFIIQVSFFKFNFSVKLFFFLIFFFFSYFFLIFQCVNFIWRYLRYQLSFYMKRIRKLELEVIIEKREI